MIRKIFNKTVVALGMLMGGVVPSFAKITVDSFSNAKLDKGLENLESGTKTAGNTFLTIMTWGAIVIGFGVFLYGVYMMASKDQREEGKLKDGFKLAALGVIFMTVSFAVQKITGIG